MTDKASTDPAYEYPAQRHDPRDPMAILSYVITAYVEPRAWVNCACYEESGVRRRDGSRCIAHVDADNARWAIQQVEARGGAR